MNELHYIPVKERRDYKKVVHKDIDLFLLFSICLLVGAIAYALFVITPTVRADNTMVYAPTTQGACERIKDTGMEVRGATDTQVSELCAANGVSI